MTTFFIVRRGPKITSTALSSPISQAFVKATQGFEQREGMVIVTVAKGEHKDGVKLERLDDFGQS